MRNVKDESHISAFVCKLNLPTLGHCFKDIELTAKLEDYAYFVQEAPFGLFLFEKEEF